MVKPNWYSVIFFRVHVQYNDEVGKLMKTFNLGDLIDTREIRVKS